MARDLTVGSIPKHVIKLAIPAVFSMFVIVINNMIDTALVGHLGISALAAVGSAGLIIWLLFSVMDIFAIGTVAIVSRNFGAGEHEDASENCQHIFRFATLF